MRSVSLKFLAAGCLIWGTIITSARSEKVQLRPAFSPPDNPLKGLVPYAKMRRPEFPHSLEFEYVPLAAVMKGKETFDWAALENLLNSVAERGHHAIFRVWLEYPGKTGGIPDFLIQEGLHVTEWGATTETRSLTPDYADARLITALESFISALGQKYDGDPRIGYITAGLLGSWGEWHTYPHEELAAPTRTQVRILDAYERAFSKTPVLLRYPAGDRAQMLANNAARPFGYHDDSFAWGTIAGSNGINESWFYMTMLHAAGPPALEKWRTHPIGGEIRPEAWGIVFDKNPSPPEVQDFAECVRQTHATWLLDSGMFREGNSPERQRRAIDQVRRLGYDFCVQSADITRHGSNLQVSLALINQGVAPFYYDWRLELAALSTKGQVMESWPVDWKLTGLLPGDQPREWRAAINLGTGSRAGQTLALRVINPLPKGTPLRFANASQDEHAAGWLSLGNIP